MVVPPLRLEPQPEGRPARPPVIGPPHPAGPATRRESKATSCNACSAIVRAPARRVPRSAYSSGLPFLRKHLVAPPPVNRQAIARLIADLDSDEFAVCDKARLALEKQGELAEDALRKALRDRPSLEMRRQIDGLLERLRPHPLSGEPLRISRAILALEWMEDAEARRLLETLARGTPEAQLTREAKAAWQRLSRLPPIKP